MELFELMKKRRSIRKYEDRPVSSELVKRVCEAGLWAPSAGGGQYSCVAGITDRDLIAKLGRLNTAVFDRDNLYGWYVSDDQPSIVDDPNQKDGFYGAPALCVVFCLENFFYSIPDAFCIAENMVLAATDLGLGSCIVSRAEDTFTSKFGSDLMEAWGIPRTYIARAFVTLGYVRGDYPKERPRKSNRLIVVGSSSQKTM